jgi:hypothetical protein
MPAGPGSREPERFVSEQQEAQHWLGILKDGKESQKIEARLGLAVIFERRGMAEEAIALLVSCIGAGHREPDTYESLGRLYAAQNRPDLSVRARAEAQQLRRRRQREQEAAEKLASARLAPVPAGGALSRGRGLSYLAAGALVTVGGFIFAASYEDGGYVLLYLLPVFGVAVLLHGLTILLSRW